MFRCAHIVVGLLALVLLSASCGEDRGFIEGTRLTLDDCGEDGPRVFEPFRMTMNVFGFESGGGTLHITGHRTGAVPTEDDIFTLLVEDEDALRDWLDENDGTALPFGGEGQAYPEGSLFVRAVLVPSKLCPANSQPLEVRGGSIRFLKLGRDRGDDVHIVMNDFSIVDTRQDLVVGEGFSGEMDFVIRGDLPHQPFDN